MIMSNNRIRTVDFLPPVFQTAPNSEFLAATLDQLVNPPSTMRIQGYVGSKLGYGVNAKDHYVTEPTKVRTDYQLDPAVVFTKPNETTAQDFITYPGIIDSLKMQGGITADNQKLFQSQFYSWDSFTDLDKLINFNQYYWIPNGPPAVTVSTSVVYSSEEYVVTDQANGYEINILDQVTKTTNPIITLLRGGTYAFHVDQSSQFWIQGAPGVTGYSPTQSNLQTRDVLGVENNGATQGIVVFTVPEKDAQSQYTSLPGNTLVDVVSTLAFDDVNGALLSTLGSVDGVTSLDGLTIMFYNYDSPVVGSIVAETIYTISYSGSPSDPTLNLTASSAIPIESKITANYGTDWANRNFYRNNSGEMKLVPYISATLDTLYYQDGTTANKVGTLRLIENNATNTLDIDTEVLGKTAFTSLNGVAFTNGLKVSFDGDVIPASYLDGEYYVQGVGTAIELIPTTSLVCPEDFTASEYIQWDEFGFDLGNYDSTLYVPADPDYITIARNAINKNAWSRSNRWFHTDVISATAEYNDNPDIVTIYATAENKATRPIIEFYPNLQLFNSGTVGKDAIDFYDTVQTDALSNVAGQLQYYPDVETRTTETAAIASATSATSTTITVLADDVTGAFQVGMYVADNMNILPTNTQIDSITGTTTLTLTVSWETTETFSGDTVSLVGTDTTVNNYGLFPEARIVFAADSDVRVRNKIYVANFSVITPGDPPVITLIEAEDGDVLPAEQVAVKRGYNYQGDSFYFDGSEWNTAQQKITVNQPPLFDVFDADGISLGNPNVYVGTSFAGNKLFSYGIGVTVDDPILGFPLRYSSIDNVGDISFDISLNLDTFSYVSGTNPITQQVNTGYVYNYTSADNYVRQLGWQTAVAPSTQYQAFMFDYDVVISENSFKCDVAKLPELEDDQVGWPRVQVFNNNVYVSPNDYTVTVTEDSTTVVLTDAPEINTVIQVLLLSDQVSNTAYYTVPLNLNNNPFNADVTTASIGDIRGQYQDIFINAPNTSGTIFGPNNYRDCGNLVPYGTKIIQNSASLALPGAFLRKQDHNLFNALLFNSREYIKYKQLIVDTVQNTDYVQRYMPSEVLDAALDKITQSKSQANAFFWSDMLPSKAPFRSNTYTFANELDNAVYPLSKTYDYSSANYDGIIVYLARSYSSVGVVQTQLIRGVDYVVSSTAPSLTITMTLNPGDTITINEYNQTYGSYVPNTPTKLGLYDAFLPGVALDSDFNQPTYFIRGHDGSYTKLYGDYDVDSGFLSDFRDQALLEFESRIYNNLKLSTTVPIKQYEVAPGFFRESDSTYSWSQYIEMYSSTFLNWVGQNRIDYQTQYFNKNNAYTYNYTNSGNKINNAAIKQGYWRGVYEYFYDTSTPNETPWEMLGFADQPTWWETRYGPSPYTSDNGILWGDLELGFVWNNGDSYYIPELARPGLSFIIPVNSNGDNVSPLISIVGNYNPSTFQKNWVVGDDGPAEFSYRRSSSWPFDLMRIFALTRPAEFFNLGVDLDNYKYSEEFNQYLVNDRHHLIISDVEIYGNGTAKTSYINWIVDYEKQVGIDATTNIESLLDNLDVRLVYRLAGYSDKTLLNFYVEKASPNSRNASLLIPDESYSVLLYDNQPFDQIVYSGLIIQQEAGGWTVFGNGQNLAYFTTLAPVYSGKYSEILVEKQKVKITDSYSTTEVKVPYGTKFLSTQEVAQFIASYGAWLKSKGMIFDVIVNGLEVNWTQMISEFLYWAQIGWADGSVVTLNPAATSMKIDRENAIVQPMTIQQVNFILNENLYPIQINNLCITRDQTEFHVHTLNQGDTMAYCQANLSNFEHGIVFDNVTLFNDVIYNLTTGLRQSRISVRGTKTAEWNGTVNAYGFILNQDNVVEWSPNLKYTKGVIVKYKNKYWTSLKIVEPSAIFDELSWKEIDYENVQKGMLPNPSTRAYESTLYYDTNNANLEQDANLLGYSLIGYRPRDYLALVDLTDVTQINVYQNMIKNKGTRNAVDAFKGANLPQGGINYDVYENWAIKSGEFGGVLNNNFVEFRLNQNKLTGNPSIVSLTDGTYTVGSQQEVPMYSLFNYGRTVTNPDVLATLNTNPTSIYPTAGYVNFDDVKMSSYYFSGLPKAVNNSNIVVPIQDFYVRDYMWLANFKETWNVYAWKPIGQVTQIRNNLNGTASVTFTEPHGLTKLEPMAIINFSTAVDGYYVVTKVLSLTEVSVNLTLTSTGTSVLQGTGLGMRFESQRVAQPSDIAALDLTESEFMENTVWVDENSDGSWATYRKNINYAYSTEINGPTTGALGSAVCYTDSVGYLVGDAEQGKVYRYDSDYNIAQEIAQGTTFGSAIANSGNVFVISEPTGASKVYIYVYNSTPLENELILYQAAISAPGGVTNWGSAVAISDDQNWIYISTEDNLVYVYRRDQYELSAGYFTSGQTYTITEVGTTDFTAIGAVDNLVGITFVATGVGSGTGTATQVTYRQSTYIDGTVAGTVAADGFGHSIATDYDGDSVLISAPFKDNGTLSDWGQAFVYQRTVQNIETQTASIPNQVQIYPLAWTPTPGATRTASATSSATNRITCNASMTGFSVNDPVIFVGSTFGISGVQANTVYYIAGISGSEISIKTTRSSATPLTLTTAASLSFSVYVQVNPLYVCVNGSLVSDNNYAVVGSDLYYTGTLLAGDIIAVSDNQFKLAQTFNSDYTNRIGAQFGYDVETTSNAASILFGAPFEILENGQEGAVYCYTSGGSKYGLVIGTSECNITTNRKVLINGFLVNLTAGDAEHVSNIINEVKITNVQAAATVDNMLMIQLVDSSLARMNEKLVISAFEDDVLDELGIVLYTKTQIIQCPHEQGATQFGTTVVANDAGSIVISAPVGNRYAGTTFDFTDDSNLDNDTVFDNNATRFVETYPNAGAAYMFDYLANYEESLANFGAYVYAQSVNNDNTDYGYNPLYGTSLFFNDNRVVIGTPNFLPDSENGQVIVYLNASGIADWNEYRQSSEIVDVTKLQNSQIFSAETNNTLVNLDYFDPMQNKLLGAVRENIDFVTAVDPAGYNSPQSPNYTKVWGADHVGQIWFNTSNVRWVNYHQDDVVYNAKHWGAVFPGSDVAVYTWVASNVLPAQYQGPGKPLDIGLYAVNTVLNSSNVVSPVYYFWVRNANVVASKLGKTLSDTIIASYIAKPINSGVAYVAPLLPNTFALYNTDEYVNANDSVFHIGFATGTSDDVAHEEFTLIRENFADDFLPGLPNSAQAEHNLSIRGRFATPGLTPESLYSRLLNSLSGCNPEGAVVPDPYLPKAVQSGIQVRPRQSFFYTRFGALKNYLGYANEVLAQYPIIEMREDASFLFETGEFFDTTDYWEYVNWWFPGYDNNSKSIVQVPIYADLSALNVAVNTLVTVEQNGAGKYEVYRYDGNSIWTRVGLENGTIQFKSSLWDYSSAKLGFGDNFFDSSPFDEYPSEETRYIIRALNEQIYVGDLLIHRNKSLILLFDYIQSETTESQNFLPWLSKTSLVDVSHTIRELLPYNVYKTDNQDFLSGYINEVKPYHVVIKEFVFKYTSTESYQGDITDFDLPAKYNSSYQTFISPQLVYTTPSNEYEYSTTSDIWNDPSYTAWYDNYGVSITGQIDYPIAILKSYMNLSSNFLVVDNSQGFPINGTFRLGTEEIGYSSVDRALNVLSGIIRGVNNSPVTDHIPGEQIIMDLPPVLLLNGGTGYTNPPRVTAVIDTSIYPEPKQAAQFEAVMDLDSVLSITVLNPGQGYAILPEIVIEPSETIYFADTQVNSTLHTVRLYAPNLVTGDIVLYKNSATGSSIDKLATNQWYYINVLETVPTAIIALYTTYSDAINDTHRVLIEVTDTATDFSLSVGARASAISTSYPIRENNITLRFDRTTYDSQVHDWRASAYYGSFFAGDYYSSDSTSSSSVLLDSEAPPINDILASAQGVVFEITDVTDDSDLEWSTFVRYISGTHADDSITLIPQDGNNDPLNPLPNASGTTLGFYVNMPIKFASSIGGLVFNTTYYVKSIIDALNFTVSETEGGSTLNLTAADAQGLGIECSVGEVTSTAILTVNYPGILTVTSTTAQSDNKGVLTVPTSEINTGGTSGFYPDLSVFFTGNVFGGIIENQAYYITTVVDDETFTISETQGPTIADITQTVASTDTVIMSTTDGFAVNDPIIFTDLSSGSSFGNIVSGQTYYVSEVVSDTELTISASENGDVFALANATGTGTVTNQIDTIDLTTASGEMIMNVNLPISPGQVNGQLFTLYETSVQYPTIAPTTTTELINRTINATIGTNYTVAVDRIAIRETEGGTTNFYVNMPIQLNASIGGLTGSTTYYILECDSYIEVTVSATVTSGNKITCDTTSSLYLDMPITFSGVGLGGITIGQEYYVKSIVNSTQFTVSETVGGATLSLVSETGIMSGLGDPYITVSTTLGGAIASLTNATGGSSYYFDQEILDAPEFDVSYILGGYRIIATDPGEGFAIDNVLTITGNLIGGSTPDNDLTMIVNEISDIGEIVSVICSGTPAGLTEQYYLKVVAPNQFAVYSNAQMTVPVSTDDFNFVGFASTTVTETQSSTDIITVTSTTDFVVNDAVVFTGDVTGNLITGQTYYILDNVNFTGTTFQVSETPGGTVFQLATVLSQNYTVAKIGSLALLPEPFYFSQSIVKFNNRVYQCIISNNDSEFVFGKWELLDSGNRLLNAMDRVIAYYQPTVNMPGVDLSQLFEGVQYPNAIYQGNPFQTGSTFDIDTQLDDQQFYPTQGDLTAIWYDDTGYLSSANFSTYSSILMSELGEEWALTKVANSNLGLTDMSYSGSQYVMTTSNAPTPLLKSLDKLIWSALGYFVPYGETASSKISISSAALSLNSIAFGNDTWVAAGNTIISSTDDAEIWYDQVSFLPNRQYELYGVTYAETAQFSGFIAVGTGLKPDYSTGETQLVPTSVLLYKSNSDSNWYEVPSLASNALYSVTTDGTYIVAVGESGIKFSSQNGVDWYGLSEASVSSFSSSNYIISISASDMPVNTAVKFSETFSTIVSGTTYYVKSIVSPTLITISDTLGGATKTLSADTVPSGTLMTVYNASDVTTDTLTDILYANTVWLAVGEDGAIKSSSDRYTWVSETSGSASTLSGIAYNSDNDTFTVVGTNNAILTSDSGDVTTWTSVSLLIVDPTVYDVEGNDFEYGYGPEELIPGLVTDSMVMTVTTAPGTSWPAVEYAHTGWNVMSVELSPESEIQTQYSFSNIVQYPAQLTVQVLDSITLLGTTLAVSDYSVDWVNKIITLDTPIDFSPNMQKLRVDVYEVGNGNQLVKSNTDDDPIRTNTATGFDEIFLNCNYSAPIYQGSGIIRPGSYAIEVEVTASDATTNRFTCVDVAQFTVNGPVVFTGTLFGGVADETTYYVKSVSYATNTITISASYVSGQAGPTFSLTTDTGLMYADTQNGTGQVWSDPIMYHNGEKLILGKTNLITKTTAVSNTITTSTTVGLVVDMPITFDQNIFGAVIQPLIVYYIQSIVDGNEFTISETLGGPVLALTTASGGSRYVTNDYAISLQPNGISAKAVFPTNTYNNGVDYLSYSFFGETTPEQYGYAVPQTQSFIGDGTTDTFYIDNYVGQDNETNAVVQVNGLRVLDTTYTINPSTNEIVFNTPPALNADIQVTTYNDTLRQYLTSSYAATSRIVVPISTINNTLTPALAVVFATATSAGSPNRITVSSTSGFVVDQTVQFTGTSFDASILTDGTVYFVASIIDGTGFTIKNASGTTIVLTGGTGVMQVTVGGLTAVRVTTTIANTFVTNDLIRIDGVEGSVQLNNNLYYVHVITPYAFDLYEQTYSAVTGATNYPVTSVSAYTIGTGYVWRGGSFYVVSASATSTTTTKVVTSDTTNLVEGTPIYVTVPGYVNGTVLACGLTQGTEYYVKEVTNGTDFSVTDVRYGSALALTANAQDFNVTQWSILDVDRLWVTVNGLRVASSKLRLNAPNEVSILTEIVPGDEIIITSMIPNATPNQEIYLNLVNAEGDQTVYRSGTEARTWLTYAVYPLSTEILVNDVSAVTNIVIQNEDAPPEVDGAYEIGLAADKRLICSVTVFNNTTNATISTDNYSVQTESLSPTLVIIAGDYISEGDSLTITTIEGNVIYVNGEMIKFTTVDFDANSLGGLSRGTNGTGEQPYIPEYTEVFGLLSDDIMSDAYYDQTWNSDVWNTEIGDPLQISETVPAAFLRTDSE